MTTTYIHYGSDHYDPSLFIPIRNCAWKPKPADGTGLWASREGKKIYHDNEYAGSVYPDGSVVYGWREWCEDSHFHTESLKKFFRFKLSDGANIVLLKDPMDLLPLPKTKPWKPKDNSGILNLPEGQMPTLEQLQKFYEKNPCFLDYEMMSADGVDAIELQNSYLFRDCLDTWDCDCIVVMNPDVIVQMRDLYSFSDSIGGFKNVR